MASGTIKGITIEIEGKTSGLVKSLGDVNKELSETQKSLRVVNKALEMDPGNLDTIRTKQALLNDAIDATRKKLELEKKAADDAAKALEDGTITKAQYDTLQAEVAKTAAELNNLEDEAKEAAQALDDVGEADTNIDGLGSKLSGLGSKLGAVAKAAGVAMAALGAAAVAAGKKVAEAASQVADYGDNVDKMSQKIGISAAEYQKLSYVFERSGTDIDNLQAGMKTLSSVIIDAGNGSAAAAEKLAAVGISLEEINGLSQEDQLNLVITRLQEMGEGSERTAAATDLLGRSATDMAAVLNMSAEETAKLKKEAEDYGMVMSDDAVKASAAFKDSLTKMKGTISGVKNALVGQLLPGMTEVMDGFSDLVAGNEKGAARIQKGLDSIIKNLSDMIPKAVKILQALTEALVKNAPQIIKALGESIVAALPEIVPALLETIVQVGKILAELVPDLIVTVVDVLASHAGDILAAGVDIVVNLATGIIKAIPELVKSIPKVIQGLINALASGEIIEQLLGAGFDIIETIFDGFLNGDFLGAMFDLVTGLLGAVAGIGGKLLEIGGAVVSKIFDGIKNAWDSVSGWVAEKLGLIDKIEGVKGNTSVLEGVVGYVPGQKATTTTQSKSDAIATGNRYALMYGGTSVTVNVGGKTVADTVVRGQTQSAGSSGGY